MKTVALNYPAQESTDYYSMNTQTKKKVLFVIDTLQVGGAERSLVANTFRFKDIEPVICHIYPGEDLKEIFVSKGIKVYSLNIKQKYGFTSAYKALKNVLEAEQPQLIVAYITRSEIIARLVGRFNNVPVIGTFITDLYTPVYNQHLSWKSKQVVNFFKFLNKITSKYCTSFIANSQAIKDSNAKHLNIPLDKIKVINRGRDSNKITCRNFTQARESNTIHFLNVSRLYPVKGQKELILAFKKFAEKVPDVKLDIAGDGPEREVLQKLITINKLDGKITLLGTRNDVPTLMCKYDCYVFPSFMEGFSGSVIEAMFAGLPVLASDIGPNKEAIQHMHTGYLFQKESIDAIEQALHWYHAHVIIANKMAEKAYYYAKENYEIDIIVDQFEKHLMESIAKHQSSRLK